MSFSGLPRRDSQNLVRSGSSLTKQRRRSGVGCPECGQDLSSVSSQTLKCLHTLCSNCVSKLTTKQGSIYGLDNVTCPICSISTSIPELDQVLAMERRPSGIRCPACTEHFFPLEASQPLSCSHTICTTCSSKLTIMGGLTCPICGKRTNFTDHEPSIAAIMPNIPTLSAAVSRHQIVENTNCANCGNKFPLSNCSTLDCSHSICSSCSHSLTNSSGHLACPLCEPRQDNTENQLITHNNDVDVEHNLVRRVSRRKSSALCPKCGDALTTDDVSVELLSCLHSLCRRCLDILVVNDRITCPLCRHTTDISASQSKQSTVEPRNRGGSVGARCPHCGRDFQMNNVLTQALDCLHSICTHCTEELTIDGSLTCPLCTRRTEFKVEDDHSISTNRWQRRRSGASCPYCGINFADEGVSMKNLECGHPICSRCLTDRSVLGELSCAICKHVSSPTTTNRRGSGVHCYHCGRAFGLEVDGVKLTMQPLDCLHSVCTVCAEELTCLGGLTCPLCQRRTQFKDELDSNESPSKDSHAHHTRYPISPCPKCGLDLNDKANHVYQLKCKHSVCYRCACKLLEEPSMACPKCRSVINNSPAEQLNAKLREAKVKPKAHLGNCTQCNRDISSIKDRPLVLKCLHTICSHCSDLVVGDAIMCPVCKERTEYNRSK